MTRVRPLALSVALSVACMAAMSLAAPVCCAAESVEQREWIEPVLVSQQACVLDLRAAYAAADPASLQPQPATFSAASACLPLAWTHTRPLRVLLQAGPIWFALAEDFSCQALSIQAKAAWQPCVLTELPTRGLFRKLWGPIRVASAELRQMQEAERQVLTGAQQGQFAEAFTDTWTEQLWVLRFCGKISETVQHFERWAACREKISGELAAVFKAEALLYPPFKEATRVR